MCIRDRFHGHFANSTLDINGHTTEDIRGPALDGRILEGAEFVTDSEAPDPTSRTEVLPVPQTPGVGEAPTEIVPPSTPPAPAPAEPAPQPDPQPQESGEAAAAPADESGANPEAAEGSDTAAPAPPPPPRVIRRLALIEDSDDGLLDLSLIHI